ncbi:hypothetical protein ACS3SW_20690 [Roseobacteraceae bacterium S113]
MARAAGFWTFYASVNDDIRTEVIDRAWYGKHIPRDSMQSAINDTAQAQELGQIALEVYGKDPKTPETIHQIGLHGQPDNNPQSTKEAIEAFYGTRKIPSGTELGGDWQAEADYADQEMDITFLEHPPEPFPLDVDQQHLPKQQEQEQEL